MSKYALTASLVCADMLNLWSEVKRIEEAGVEYIHIDVMDGHFVPRFWIHPEMVAAVRSITNIPMDVHFMTNNPEPYISSFVKAWADIITVHPEDNPNLHRTIKMIKDSGAKAGVALNMATPLSVLDYVLDDISLVMLMAINPWIVGHKLIPQAMRKIADLKEKLRDYPDIIIEIDGGVTFESAPEMVASGANLLVCGSSTIFRPEWNLKDKVTELRNTIDVKIS